MKVAGPKMAPRQGGGGGGGGLGSDHRNTYNIFKKNLLPNQLAQMLEIQYVALPCGPLLILFK